jgi:hypothetical protein
MPAPKLYRSRERGRAGNDGVLLKNSSPVLSTLYTSTRLEPQNEIKIFLLNFLDGSIGTQEIAEISVELLTESPTSRNLVRRGLQQTGCSKEGNKLTLISGICHLPPNSIQPPFHD